MGSESIPSALVHAVESLIESIEAGRTDIFRKLLETCETTSGKEETQRLINSPATQYGTFLHMATKLGRGDIVRSLLACGGDAGIHNSDGNTPLQLAPSTHIITIFTEQLLTATAQSQVGRVCQLVAAGLSINSHDNPLSRNTPLHWAASFANSDTVNCLIARGADVNACNSDGATPLHDAIGRGDKAIVRILLDHDANPHIQCYKGRFKGKTGVEMCENNIELMNIMTEYLNSDKHINGGFTNGVANGSISPLIQRTESINTDASLRRTVSSSFESLTSLGADSVITLTSNITSNEPSNGPAADIHKPRDVTQSVNSHPRSPRSPLQSTSSLELSPNMEQVCERLAAAQLTAPPRPLVTHNALHQLWPQPQRIRELSGPPWVPPANATLAIVQGPVPIHKIVDVWDIHKGWLEEAGCIITLGCVFNNNNNNIQQNDQHTFTCIVNSTISKHHDQYTLTIKQNKVVMTCGSLSSLHCALGTLRQLIRICGSVGVPSLIITDYPSIQHRAFLMDVSPHARVPTLERLLQMVDTLLGLKINEIHLMMRVSSSVCNVPYIHSEIVSLDRYCVDRGISLIPGFEIDGSIQTSHIKNVTALISASLCHFPSARQVHIGPRLTAVLAEGTAEGGIGCAWDGIGCCDMILYICANVFHDKQHLLNNIPPTTVLVEYGFQADYDFSRGLQLGVESGHPVAVCPGTAAWSSLSGWPEGGVSNVYGGIINGVECGVIGVIVAQWYSELTPFIFAWPPILVAAGLAWNHDTHWDYVHSSVGSLLDTHLLGVPGCGVGGAIVELGRCETWCTRIGRGQSTIDVTDLPSSSIGSILYQLFTQPDNTSLDNLNTEVFTSVMRHVRRAVREGGKGVGEHEGAGRSTLGVSSVGSISTWPLANLLILELHLAMDMILTACRLGRALVSMGSNPGNTMGISVVNPGVANLPPTIRTDLANKVLGVREVFSSVWLEGNQNNGLKLSLSILSTLLTKLLPNYQ